MNTSTKQLTLPSRRAAALAGLAAGAAALGGAELLAGILPGAASPTIAVGDLVISLQPPGAKQFVDLFGEADKLLLNLLVAFVALVLAAGLGLLARTRPGLARIAIALGAIVLLAAGLRDPLSEPITTLLVVAAAVAIAIGVLTQLLRMAAEHGRPPLAEMPSWGRRRFLGTSIAVIGVAAASGVAGRALLAGGRLTGGAPQVGSIPKPTASASPPPSGGSLEVPGLSPLITPNRDFYRIDTALLVPRPDVDDWRLSVTGMVERPFELTYDELAALPLHEQYVTIACVSNEVGGNLVGNALWTGVHLKDLLERAGVNPAATQIVGRSVDGFTAGFPTAWALADDREALVAIAMNGEPLPPNHGFPARLIVPGLYGYVSATKWLSEIELTTLEAFDAYWVPLGWDKEAPILTQSRIDVPREGARVEAGTIAVAGVAWAPDRGVSAVEVQIDEDGWEPAELSAPISDATWVQFVRRWEATAGEHLVRVRAIDGDGETQTDQKTPPAPNGARGHHTIRVTVT